MKEHELLRLAEWLNQNILKERIPHLYENLSRRIDELTQPDSVFSKYTFGQDREGLINSLRTVNLNSLTMEQIDLLSYLDIIDKLSTEDISNIELLLR